MTLHAAVPISGIGAFRRALLAGASSAMTGLVVTAGWSSARMPGWLAAFGKLRIRFERRIDIYVALLSLACCIVCFRKLEPFC